MSEYTRRDVLKHSAALASAAIATTMPCPIFGAQQQFCFGYAAITWGGDDRQAIADIEAVGFPGIQLRTSTVDTFGDRPAELKEPGVMRALPDVGFSGWIVVELDAVPDNARSPKEAAELNRRYLTERLKQTI